jgi:dinuclear metal center YbgI/SA1388 family protein
MPKVIEFYNKINGIAPFRTAYDWDNVGLLIGDMQSEVEKVLFALDVTDQIVDYAIKVDIDLIICHHPIICFRPLKNITDKKILRLIEHKIAVIAAHTNLDVSPIGVNFMLAEKLALKNIQPLSMSDINQYQISVYTPDHAINEVMNVMLDAGAGLIGRYDRCATYFHTFGQFRPLSGANPFRGQISEIEKVKEHKIEMRCEEMYLSRVIDAMLISHPYETPAYTIVPLKQKSPNFGIGCLGELESEQKLNEFALFVKNQLGAIDVRLWLAKKSEDTIVKKIAVCGGGGNSIIHETIGKADVFISSDFTYHQFLDATLPVIDAGHYFTENPMMSELKQYFSDFSVEMVDLPQSEHDISKLVVI